MSVTGWYFWSLRPVDANDHTAHPVTIAVGLAVSDIAHVLEAKGIIRSAFAFSLYARFHGSQAALQAGEFILEPAMAVPDVIIALQKAKPIEASVTIPEGFTVSDIDALLAKKGLIDAGVFTRCAQTCDFSGYSFLPTGAAMPAGRSLGEGRAKRGGRVEGYLFPDTYSVFTSNFDTEKFLKRLLETFRTRVVSGLERDFASSKRSLHEIITMASLIEEETKADEERSVVSGILWKRFEAKQGLGVDATVRYILEKPTSAITTADLDVDSPYNLRKYRGLPPGAIANPGLESIKAALHPVTSQYWYYLHGKDGVIRYAVTNDEHNRNKAQYLR